MEKFPEMTRYWFYLTFDVDSFLAIQRKYEVNHSYVCYCENTKYTQHDEKRRKYKHQYSLVIFRRKKRRNVTIYRRYVIVEKVYDLSCTYNAYFFIYRNTKRASESFFTLLYVRFDKLNLKHLLNISTSCID